MTEKTQKAMLQELHQVIIGIAENPHDNGLIGTVSNIDTKLTILNGTVTKNSNRLSVIETDVVQVKESIKDTQPWKTKWFWVMVVVVVVVMLALSGVDIPELITLLPSL